MFSNVLNDVEWKKIISKEFIDFKKTRKIIRDKLIKDNYREKKNRTRVKKRKKF